MASPAGFAVKRLDGLLREDVRRVALVGERVAGVHFFQPLMVVNHAVRSGFLKFFALVSVFSRFSA